jgi:hypothetical protein
MVFIKVQITQTGDKTITMLHAETVGDATPHEIAKAEEFFSMVKAFANQVGDKVLFDGNKNSAANN